MNAMPVRMPVAEQDSVGPYNRMSASQANTYEACPRLWFYQKVYRFKMPQIPVLFVGRAVEEAVCRVLRESPGFVVASSSPEALEASPYKDDGTPISAAERSWPASGLMPLFPNFLNLKNLIILTSLPTLHLFITPEFQYWHCSLDYMTITTHQGTQ